MASRHVTPTSDRWSVASFLPCIPIALIVGGAMAALGSEWRATLSQYPTDPIPATGLFLTGIVSALVMLFGLALVVSAQRPAGAWVLAAGVALIGGAAIGFMIGPDVDLLISPR